MAYSKEQIEEIFNDICNKIAEEGLSVRTILKADNMPSFETFYKWLNDDDEKSKQYARACEIRADLIFEDILHIADDVSKDSKTVDISGIEIETIDKENIQRSRLRVDARKWIVSKMNPKKYGDRVQQDININSEQPLFGDGE